MFWRVSETGMAIACLKKTNNRRSHAIEDADARYSYREGRASSLLRRAKLSRREPAMHPSGCFGLTNALLDGFARRTVRHHGRRSGELSAKNIETFFE
jgi:hypothetical protein